MAKAALANQALLTAPELQARLGELYAAIAQFNRRWYFESHETLEDLWMVTPLPERQLFQGIIQLAAAFVHFVRGEYPGVLKLLDASLEKLREFTPERFGIDTASLVVEVARVRDEIAALGEQRFREFDERRAPVIRVDTNVAS
jgi:predicted metal-dependent hydrolase